MPALLSFPEHVDERAARVVATGVVAMTGAAAVQPLLLAPLVYGFAARVLAGPTLSPLGQVATRVVVPRLPGPPRPTPGAPKRLAQGLGLAMSGTALLLRLSGRPGASRAVLGVLLVAAGLESALGICLACRAFPLLVRAGLVPETACAECADLSRHRMFTAEHTP